MGPRPEEESGQLRASQSRENHGRNTAPFRRRDLLWDSSPPERYVLRLDFRISVTGLVNLVVASHPSKPKIRNEFRNLPQPVTAVSIFSIELLAR